MLPKFLSMIIFFMPQNLKNLALSDIMDIVKIKTVNQPIDKANGLPNECYTSSEYLKYEKEKVFKDKFNIYQRNYYY